MASFITSTFTLEFYVLLYYITNRIYKIFYKLYLNMPYIIFVLLLIDFYISFLKLYIYLPN